MNSVESAETIAAEASIWEGQLLVEAYEQLPNVKRDLLTAVDSKDLYDTLSTFRKATDRSIRADWSVRLYEFENRM